MLSAAPWIASHDLAQRALESNLQGITDAEALIAPMSASNCVNWLVGHILLYRDRTHRVLGLEPAWPERLGISEPYQGGGARPTADLAVSLSELRAELIDSHRVVRVRLAELRPEDLVAPASATRTVGEQLALFGAHDLYHIGQLGVVRRLLGKPGAVG